MQNNKNSFSEKITVLSVLSAITALLAFLPLRTLGAEISLCPIILCVAAVLYGVTGGTVVGLVFGTVSFLQCFGYSVFGATILEISPVAAFLTCVPTRILAGALVGLIFKLINKKFKTAAVGIASVLAPVLNTLFFTAVFTLSFWNSGYVQGMAATLKTVNPFIFAVLFVGVNGIIEIAAGVIIALPVSKAILKIQQKRGN